MIIIPSGSPVLKLREPIRKFGAAAHPDHLIDKVNFDDKFYLKQLQAYKDTTGDDPKQVTCSRPHLLEKLS